MKGNEKVEKEVKEEKEKGDKKNGRRRIYKEWKY